MKTVPHRGGHLPCFALCAALTLAAGCATRRPELGTNWFACSRDAQCTFMQDPADCARFPINKRYASSFAQHLTIDGGAALPSVECEREVADAPAARRIVVGRLEYLAICEDARCSSEPRRNRRGAVRTGWPDLPKARGK